MNEDPITRIVRQKQKVRQENIKLPWKEKLRILDAIMERSHALREKLAHLGQRESDKSGQ